MFLGQMLMHFKFVQTTSGIPVWPSSKRLFLSLHPRPPPPPAQRKRKTSFQKTFLKPTSRSGLPRDRMQSFGKYIKCFYFFNALILGRRLRLLSFKRFPDNELMVNWLPCNRLQGQPGTRQPARLMGIMRRSRGRRVEREKREESDLSEQESD
jgi:hypothetical protein